MKKIVICGGHLTPALALIDLLKKEKDVKIFFFGRKFSAEGSNVTSAEYKIIEKLKIKFFPLTAGRLQRKFTKYTIPSILKIPIGFVQSLLYLITLRPHMIVSFGGYLSCPPVIGGWLLGIRSITHEQSSVPGLANKINSLFVEKIFLTWPQTKEYFDRQKTEVIGNLIRDAVFAKNAGSKKISDFLKKSDRLIYVTGGNQGSHVLNRFIARSKSIFSNFYVIHQVGTINYKGDYDLAKRQIKNNYLPVDYIDTKDIGAVLNKASLIISRAGANTVWEIASLAKPSILIPLPIAAGNEQLENAKILENAHTSIVIAQKNLTEKTIKWAINQIFQNKDTYEKFAASFRDSLTKNAAKKLAKFILRYT